MIKSLSKTVLIGALSTFLSLQSVSASVIETMTAQDVSDAINIAIIDAKVIDDESNGHKVVEGRIDNYVFFVRLKSCEETNTFCRDLVFFANFELDREPTLQDFKIANSYNDEKVYGRAYVLEDANQVGIDYVVALGGVTDDHVQDDIDRWAFALEDFVEHFKEGYSEQ